MTSTNGLSETAQAVLDVLTATAQPDEQGRLVSTETLYRFLMQRFGLPDAQARRLRTQTMHELRDAGLVRRLEERGPRVELLDVPTDLPGYGSLSEPPVSYDEYADSLDGQDLDAPAVSSRRLEQAFLRRVLLQGRDQGDCAFCGRRLPARLLLAAHVKRRADLDRALRLRFRDVAVLACALGCDSLFEHGYLGVAYGRLVTAEAQHPELAQHLARLHGRPFTAYSDLQARLLEEHLLERFLPQG